ncbi:hypothetical protein [Peribacillus butanolivorans]
MKENIQKSMPTQKIMIADTQDVLKLAKESSKKYRKTLDKLAKN